jgi:hypothetical protein
MAIHELKCAKPYFDELKSGDRTSVSVLTNTDFQKGDCVTVMRLYSQNHFEIDHSESPLHFKIKSISTSEKSGTDMSLIILWLEPWEVSE